MKKGYWVVAYQSVSDEEALKGYTELAIPAIEAAGGKFIVRGFADAVIESGIDGQRTAVIEFESVEKAIAAYNNEAYVRARQVLNNGAVRDFRFVEGLL
jgi:uncharacterized protein (DUF1330 family)